jgi:dTDP-4-amino-4,6-dideoxygalactose transaminase
LLPLTEKIAKSALTLPLFPDMKMKQVDMVVNALSEQLYTGPVKG